MRLSGRLSAAIEVLEDMAKHHRPVAIALKDWGMSHRFAGSGDRAAIGTIVYDVLRNRASLGWRMDADTPTALAYAGLFAMMKSHSDLAELVAEMAGDAFAPPPLDAACLHAWQSRDLRQAPDDIQADIPSWAVDYFKDLYGGDWLMQARALSERPPLDLRHNVLKISTEKLATTLSDEQAQAISWFDTAWRIEPTQGFARHPNVQASQAFQKGWFEIQDLGSQIVAYLTGVQPDSQVLDYCAGGGGKTLALAAMMANHGQIYAYDADRARLAPIFSRLQRAGVRNVQIVEKCQELAPLEGKMDLVLVDAPCSGSGTWRRHPDAKWRLRPSQLERRIQEQRAIIDKASHFVRPGGRLAYITCSLFENENNRQMRDFMAHNPDFHAIDMRTHWHSLMPEQAPRPHFCDIGLTLSPASTMSDGFYIAILEQNAIR